MQVGTRRFEARAEPVLDAARRQELMAQMLPYWNRHGPPTPIRWLLQRFSGSTTTLRWQWPLLTRRSCLS